MECDGPVVGYRWFRVRPGGALAGANNVVWPSEAPIRAEHRPLTPLDRPGKTTLARLVWAAASPLERVGGLFALATVVAAALVTGASAVLVGWLVGLTVFALSGSIRGRRPVFGGLLVGSFWFVSLAAATLVAVSAVRALSLLGGSGGSPVVGLTMSGGVLGLCAAVAITHRGRGRGGRARRCPCPPRRWATHHRPECGIHAYKTLAQAVRGARSEWVVPEHVLVAEVACWGDGYEYSEGWRSEYGQVTAIYDDGRGHAELAAVAYRVPVRPLPDASPDELGVRLVGGINGWVRRVRAWAEHRVGNEPGEWQ